jgi:hypothetical protein
MESQNDGGQIEGTIISQKSGDRRSMLVGDLRRTSTAKNDLPENRNNNNKTTNASLVLLLIPQSAESPPFGRVTKQAIYIA